MGCFNKIGFVSSLPILMNDECVLIFMKETNGYKSDKIGGTTYPTDLFIPMFLPVFGNYDDYGRIEYVKETNSTKFIEEFFGMPIDDVIRDVDDNAVGRGKKKESPKNNEIFQKLTFGLEHKSVYDKMVSEFKHDKLTPSILQEIKRSGRELKMNGAGFSDDDFLGKYLAKEQGIEYVDPINKFIEYVGEDSILSMYAFATSMHVLNSKYFPSNYGSQSQDFALHYKLLTLYRNIVVNKLSDYEGDDVINSLREEIRDEQLTNILRK